MPCNPLVCPDCSYPPNFSILQLPITSEALIKYEIECRDCGDVWVELDDEAHQEDVL